MRNLIWLLAVLPYVHACNGVECADGTIERDGECQPANVTTGAGMCGPFTELQGDRCVPMFPPTECDPTTTTPTVDPETGVTTCIGTGGGGCSAKFACPTPTEANRLTVCGQIFDLETNLKFQAQDASGTPCDPQNPTTTGPCALNVTPYDAIQFASNPQTAAPRPFGSFFMDDCGRYRVVDIDTNGTGPFIGLGIDDLGMPNGPAGVTVTVGVATGKASPVVADFEGWIVKASTTQLWADSGGPSLAGGIYVAAYRRHKLRAGVDRHAPQEGVTFAHQNGTTYPSQDYYFASTELEHRTIDPNATMTGFNGSALVTGRSVAESAVFVGQGGLGPNCRWEPHAAASLPGIVFVQIYRKTETIGAMPGSCQD